MKPTRREFIGNGFGFVSLGMVAPAVLARASQLTPGGRADRILVVLQLSGGNDGLNTVIPYTDPLYYQNRPTIGIPKASVVPLSNTLGLHPGMASLKPLFEKGTLAVVQGAGYPSPNRSHFRSMEIWQTADPVSTVVREGWLGRYFDDDGHLIDNPLSGINLGGELPRTLFSDFGSVVSMQSPATFQLQPIAGQERDAELKAFTDLYSTGTMATDSGDLVRKIGMDAYTSSATIKKALRAEPGDGPEPGSASGQSLDAPPYPAGRTGGQLSPLAQNLKTVAQLIGADLGTRVYYISTGSFDTHANQPNTQALLLKDVSDSISAFYADLEQRGLADHVALITFSEFGRRVQENASAGTDHGAASCMFVVGGKIKGGFYGTYPALDDLYEGDLKFNVDFRQVYATILDGWLDAPSEKILGGRFQHLGLLA